MVPVGAVVRGRKCGVEPRGPGFGDYGVRQLTGRDGAVGRPDGGRGPDRRSPRCSNLGAFAVVCALPSAATLVDYRGLITRRPWLAISLVVCLLGLVGTRPQRCSSASSP